MQDNQDADDVAGKEPFAWTDGHFSWHAGWMDVDESDVEVRAYFSADKVPQGEVCDSCGRPKNRVCTSALDRWLVGTW